MDKLTKEECIALIREKFEEKGRVPCKSDFNNWEVMMIKSHLGPLPRAMETAGVKPPRSEEKIQAKIDKRLRSKKRKEEYKARKKDNE